jgi:hypothetical protein
MTDDTLVRAGGLIAIASGSVSAIGLVFLVAMFALFRTPLKTLGLSFGLLNDICVAVQYLLTIPLALVLHRLLLPYQRALIRAATIVGIVSMAAVVLLQLALIFKALSFRQQGPWVTLAMILGVGFWLMVTGLVARSSGSLPHSVAMSALAVPYLGYPAWAFWLGRLLLR